MWNYIIIALIVAFVLLLCFCLAVANFSFDNFQEKLKAMSQKRNSAEISTLDFVNNVNKKSFSGKLKLTQCQQYKDHYSSNEISLSENTLKSNSLASLSTVAHELGHAKQDYSGKKLATHWKNLHFGRILGFLFMPLMLSGAVLGLLYIFNIFDKQIMLIASVTCLSGGLFIFLFALILKFREIQIEKEASKFGVEFLKEFLTESEIEDCIEFLDSARFTYWASLFRTMFGWTLLTKKEKMFR